MTKKKSDKSDKSEKGKDKKAQNLATKEPESESENIQEPTPTPIQNEKLKLEPEIKKTAEVPESENPRHGEVGRRRLRRHLTKAAQIY